MPSGSDRTSNARSESETWQDNGGDNLSLGANGAFAFAGKFASSTPYAATVLTQPVGQRVNVTVACSGS